MVGEKKAQTAVRVKINWWLIGGKKTLSMVRGKNNAQASVISRRKKWSVGGCPGVSGK